MDGSERHFLYHECVGPRGWITLLGLQLSVNLTVERKDPVASMFSDFKSMRADGCAKFGVEET